MNSEEDKISDGSFLERTPNLGRGGYYDKNGNWVRLKYCFISCGEQCDCMPPNHQWHIKPLKE